MKSRVLLSVVGLFAATACGAHSTNALTSIDRDASAQTASRSASAGFTRVLAPLKRVNAVTPGEVPRQPFSPGAKAIHITPYTGLTPSEFAALEHAMKRTTRAPRAPGLKPLPFPGTATTGPPASLQVTDGLGLCDGGTYCFFPSDDALAASPNGTVQVINGAVGVFSPAGMLENGWPKSAPEFFGSNYGACSGFLFDPRALYDITTQRFFVAMIEDEGGAGSACATERLAWIAVSDSSDPGGGWHTYTYDLSGTTTPAFGIDYTRIGVDRRGFYLSVNNQAAAICSFDKYALENGTQTDASCFANLTFNGIVTDSMQPVLTLPGSRDEPPAELFVESENIHFGGGQCRDGCSGIIVWALANPGPAASLTSAYVPSAPYIVAPFADQPGCTECVTMADTRISETPVWSNGEISFALDTGINNGTNVVPGILWGELQPELSGDAVVGGRIDRSGYVFFSGSNAAGYPAVMPDGSGDLYMAFDFMGPSAFPSVAYTSRNIRSGSDTFFAPRIVKLGTGSTLSGAWGDYSAASFDGGGNVWMASQYGDSGGGYGTALAKIRR